MQESGERQMELAGKKPGQAGSLSYIGVGIQFMRKANRFSSVVWSIAVAGAVAAGACSRGHRGGGAQGGVMERAPVAVAPAVAMPSDSAAVDGAIRFLENRVKLDPEDHIAYNKLGGYYLQRLRETGSITYLELATRAADASLATL